MGNRKKSFVQSFWQTAKNLGFTAACWKDLEAPRNTAGDSISAQPLETASGIAQEIENEYPLVQQFHFCWFTQI